MSRAVRVAIIGAGLGGVAAAVSLKRAAIDTFTVFEKAAGPGGVWWQNTYPGCEVDIPSLAYSYSFMPYDWSGTHATQAELQRYVEDVIDRFDIRAHFSFGVGVERAVWDGARKAYTVYTTDGADAEFDLVVSAVGMLSHPKLPDWPGLETFEGPVFHTSRFDHALDLAGRRVAIVGTGSTACQLGPAIAPQVRQLDVYQREPGYVLPKKARVFDDDERRRYRDSPVRRRIDRLKLYRMGHRSHDALRVGTENNKKVEAYFRHYVARTVRDPAVRDLLTPNYPYGCKRPVYASTYFPMFNRDNVSLVPHAVVEVAPDGLIDDTGTKRPADVLILSTGFQAASYLSTVRIQGRGGRDLHDVWAGEPWAFLGVTVPGFPNFFMLYGPNTNGGFSMTTQLEIQAEQLVRVVRRLRRTSALDTRPRLAERVDRWVQGQIAVTMSSAGAGCHNYYHAASGKNVTQWPRSHTVYRIALRALSHWVLTARAGGT